MKYIYTIFIILLVDIVLLKKIQEKAKLNSKSCLPQDLLQQIKENVLQFSIQPRCKTHCRMWPEMRELAFCKIKLLSEFIDQPYNIFYQQTDYKTEAKNEIAKFTFIAIKDQESVAKNNQESQMRHVKGGSFFLKVCVPTDQGQHAWIDDRCPFDDCVRFTKFTMCNVNIEQEINEDIEKDIFTLIPQDNNNLENIYKSKQPV